MKRKEIMEKIFASISDEKKDEFVVKFREAETTEAKKEVLSKYGIVLTKEDVDAFFSNELDDDELDTASGGCFSHHGTCRSI